jgi:hypothetical protein
MPLVGNDMFFSGNVVWECAKCGRVFVFVDEGEKHEKKCDGKKPDKKTAGSRGDESKSGK